MKKRQDLGGLRVEVAAAVRSLLAEDALGTKIPFLLMLEILGKGKERGKAQVTVRCDKEWVGVPHNCTCRE